MDTEPVQPKQKRLSRKRWTPSLDKVLADLVVKQIQLGNRQNNVFDRKTWLNIRTEFNHQTGLNYNNNQLRKHLNVLRQRYDSVKSSQLHNQLVLEDTGCILGLDLWEDFDVQPRSEPVKVKDCPIYEQLCTIYGDVSSEGMYAQSSHFEGLEESMPNHTSESLPPTPNVERKRKREADTKTSHVSPSQIDPAVMETMAGDITMIGSFLTRALIMVFGYAYPSYECFKTVERNKPEIQQLQFWCQYWILVAALTVLERVGDALVSWLPLYSEAKLAFFVYLWFPKTKGTTYVYNVFFKPYVSKHENDIDRNLMEIKTRAGDMAMIYLQKAFAYGHARFFEILQYIREQSTPKPQSKEKKETTTPQLDDPALTVTEENKATHDEMKKKADS